MPLDFRALFDSLLGRFGPQYWWPAETPFEMIIGAVLVQNTAWRNVEIAINQLRDRGLLHPDSIFLAEPEALQDAIRPSGFMRAKGQTCKTLANWILARAAFNGGVDQLSDSALRTELLALKGVGPETADVIMLYAFGRSTFIWDQYARRLLSSQGQLVPGTYEGARRRFSYEIASASFTHEEFAEFHALVVEAGRRAAVRRVPQNYSMLLSANGKLSD